MEQTLYPASTREIAQRRKELAPRQLEAFQAFSTTVFAAGAPAAPSRIPRWRSMA